ncbi:MAG: leucyl/phenylalanyl-tRNA--protein transferase [Alphaproteobacteria bacterium]|nr:leucyl/phenylalanyl-tRNA--protein transferase [Alphaproteobacteria bacterium]
MHALSPETLIKAYTLGVFPMAEAHDDERIFFVDPDERGVLPLAGVHIPRSLRKRIRKQPYTIKVNTAFDAVIDACRELTDDRTESWINPKIRQLYCALHRYGFSHSIEAWQTVNGKDVLVGGLYGVALKGAFFGESMFSRATDASKIALVHLMARLVAGGYTLLDTQFTNPHLEQFGVQEIPRDEFKIRLGEAMMVDAKLPQGPQDMAMVQSFLQANTDTS